MGLKKTCSLSLLFSRRPLFALLNLKKTILIIYFLCRQSQVETEEFFSAIHVRLEAGVILSCKKKDVKRENLESIQNKTPKRRDCHAGAKKPGHK